MCRLHWFCHTLLQICTISQTFNAMIIITHQVTKIVITLGAKKNGYKTLQLRWRCLSQQPTRYVVSTKFAPVRRPCPTRCGLPGYVGRQTLIHRTLQNVSTAIGWKSNLSVRERTCSVFRILLHWQLLWPESRSGSCWMDWICLYRLRLRLETSLWRMGIKLCRRIYSLRIYCQYGQNGHPQT